MRQGPNCTSRKCALSLWGELMELSEHVDIRTQTVVLVDEQWMIT